MCWAGGLATAGPARLTPLAPNPKQWLAPLHQGSGKVIPFEQFSWKLRRLTAKESVGFKWKHNALRHSFIS